MLLHVQVAGQRQQLGARAAKHGAVIVQLDEVVQVEQVVVLAPLLSRGREQGGRDRGAGGVSAVPPEMFSHPNRAYLYIWSWQMAQTTCLLHSWHSVELLLGWMAA